MEKEVSGIMVYYYKVCKRKLWYFSNGITMEHNSEDVKIGKSIDEDSYYDEDKHINIKNVVNIDYIKEKNIIHEVKKSKIVEEASIDQLKYYIWYLEKHGVEGVSGVINYPLIKRVRKVSLSEEDKKEIPEMISDIKRIIEDINIPELEEKKICKNCSYKDICFL